MRIQLLNLENEVPVEIGYKLLLCLVGRLLTSWAFNVEAFKRTITQFWGLQKKVIIGAIETNLFVFQFFHWRDKENILIGCPWCFDQHLLVLNEIKGNEHLAHVPLSFSPFWVRIRNLPLNCRSRDDIKTIASTMGIVMDIENNELRMKKH